MRVDVEFKDGAKIDAKFNGFVVHSDQSIKAGGEASAPEPFDYFDVALALCAGHYVKSFCEQRDISTDGIEISQDSTKDSENRYKRYYTLTIKLPESFPSKYKKAVELAAANCAVKKVVTTGPEFKIIVEQ